jgi:PPOX class probable FMN-dependent enzyme
MHHAFDEVITTRARLRQLLPAPEHREVSQKHIGLINEAARRFIAVSPFVVLATRGGDGRLDVSPKGDPAGFVEVLDEHTLVVPDRLGNHRLDSYENLLVDPSLALIFIIPGHTETLRVAGRGRIVLDRAVQSRHVVNGKPPVLALVVDVEEAFMHCSKSFVRSRMWQPDRWPDRAGAPSLAEWVQCTVTPERTVGDLQAAHDNDARTRLY